MPDLPDWYQGFQLVGSDITINVNIEASDVTLPISIDAATATIDVNLESQDVNIDFNFADQAVAVFDAAKWFAHEADQVFNNGSATITEASWGAVIDYTVPTGKVFYAVGVANTGPSFDGEIYSCQGYITIGGTTVHYLGNKAGAGLPLDTPLRATAGQHVILYLRYWGVSATGTMYGSIWGYTEDV